MAGKRGSLESAQRAVALYHVVYAHEGFEDAAPALFKLVQQAQERCPGKPRKLFLDIEGHRNSQGGFEADMLELQKDFLMVFLARFVTEIHCPLGTVTNSKPQDNDVPPALTIQADCRS
jgi:hypothetical protein